MITITIPLEDKNWHSLTELDTGNKLLEGSLYLLQINYGKLYTALSTEKPDNTVVGIFSSSIDVVRTEYKTNSVWVRTTNPGASLTVLEVIDGTN